MKVGITINRFDYAGGDAAIRKNLKAVAQAAEGAGFDSAWVMDHFFQLPYIGPADDPMMESYTTLGFLAGVTEKVTLGTMVAGVIYREPALLIKAVTTLDVLSGGRAYFGIGAGWYEEEAIALSFMNPLRSKRFDRLEDTLQLAKQMWSGDRSAFKGKVYHLPEPISEPQPVQKPHPPILIGGGGEEKTLRFVAKYGDACNLFARDMELAAHKLEVLKKHCKEVGRDYNEIEKTCMFGMDVDTAAKSRDAVMRQAEAMVKLGFTHTIFAVSKSADLKTYDRLAKMIKELHAL